MQPTTKRELFEQSNTWLLDLTRQILAQMEGYIHPARAKLEREVGSLNDAMVHLAEIAIGMEPEPFGLAHVYQCIPYANPELFRQDFEGAVRNGWLAISAEGTYRATEKSRQFHNQLNRELRQIYRDLRPLPMMQLERLDALLAEMIAAMRDTAAFAHKPAFEMDLRLAPVSPSTLQKICCKLSHLLAFRDDAYLNAWMEKEINSYVWEAFSYIYKGQAHTAASLAQQLESQRQYDERSYAAALAELESRGWIVENSGKYEPTVAGLQVLSEVARMMTLNFFEPWADLEEEKISQLKMLLEALLHGLKSPQIKGLPMSQASAGRSFSWRTNQWLRDKER